MDHFTPSTDPVLNSVAWSAIVGLLPLLTFFILLAVVMTRRLWFSRRLAPKSPLLLSALTALSNHWREDASALPVLSVARQHPDPEIRAAAGGRSA